MYFYVYFNIIFSFNNVYIVRFFIWFYDKFIFGFICCILEEGNMDYVKLLFWIVGKLKSKNDNFYDCFNIV